MDRDVRMMPRVRFALAAAVALVLVASRAWLAPPAPSLDGGWTGTAVLGARHHTMDTTATLGQTGRSVVGTITFAGSDGQAFTVTGVVRGRRARLAGVIGAQSLVWRGRWRRGRHVWRGRLRMRTAKRTKRGRLTLGREIGGPAPECGGDLFAQELMPRVFEPICAQCHVAGGLAQSTRLRVTVGDPVATSRTAVALVDAADPPRSLLLLKPRGEASHGGAQRVVPGSAEDELLRQWVELVTTPGCDGGNGGGGGGGGGGGTGDLYADNCASCHGADARGLDGRPDIHCSRSIHDVVRNGRKGSIGDMPAFPNLSDADIVTIQAFLRGLCPTTGVTGAELYAGNCASCHGADATGTADAPSVRCATRVTNAVRVGRGAAMPSFPALTDTEVALIDGHLGSLCAQAGRTGADLYAGNCATCHGATARGGRNALGVHGPSIRCTGANDYREKVREGDDAMPAFPALDASDVNAIVDFVHGAYCTGG